MCASLLHRASECPVDPIARRDYGHLVPRRPGFRLRGRAWSLAVPVAGVGGCGGLAVGRDAVPPDGSGFMAGGFPRSPRLRCCRRVAGPSATLLGGSLPSTWPARCQRLHRPRRVSTTPDSRASVLADGGDAPPLGGDTSPSPLGPGDLVDADVLATAWSVDYDWTMAHLRHRPLRRNPCTAPIVAIQPGLERRA